jgi:hypothetical protein
MYGFDWIDCFLISYILNKLLRGKLHIQNVLREQDTNTEILAAPE